MGGLRFGNFEVFLHILAFLTLKGYGLTETSAGVINVFGEDSLARPLSTFVLYLRCWGGLTFANVYLLTG